MTLGYMCDLPHTFAHAPSASVTGSFPIGYILVLFTALGMIWDGSRLSSCSPKWCRAAFPATDISAPESGRVVMLAFLLRDNMWMLMVGVGSTVLGWGGFYEWSSITGSAVSRDISARCLFVASWARHVVIIFSSDKSFSFRRSSIVSPSRRPSMI